MGEVGKHSRIKAFWNGVRWYFLLNLQFFGFFGIITYLMADVPAVRAKTTADVMVVIILIGGVVLAIYFGVLVEKGFKAGRIAVGTSISDYFLTLPLVIFLIANVLEFSGAHIFDAETCPNVKVKDYGWFVVDNFAKGTFIDVLQSYSINLYTCPPRKTFLVGSINFIIRIYATFVAYRALVALTRYLWSNWRDEMNILKGRWKI